MARRVNKKVALLGTVLVLIMFVVFFIIAQEKDIFTSQAKLIEDGDAALAEKDYETAKEKYLRARARAETDESRLKVLSKLINVYLETEDWPPLQGIWHEVLNIEPNNLAIRYARLKYAYIVADSGAGRVWEMVENQASEFIDIVEQKDMLDADTAQWERPEYQKVGLMHEPITGSDGIQHIGQYLYLLKGRARLARAASGALTEPLEGLEQAMNDLEKAQQLDPTNTEVAWQLARAYITRGELLASRGSFDERQKAMELALEVLEEAVEKAPNDPKGHINKLMIEQRLAQMKDPEIDRREEFEGQYIELSEKFPDNPFVHAVISRFYRGLGPAYLDEAIEAIEKARRLDPNNVAYALSAGDAYSLKGAIEDAQDARNKAVSILNSALQLPGAQETEGPRQYENMNNRVTVYSYLSSIYLERLLLKEDIDISPQEKQELLSKAQEAIHEIEQILGSGEDPTVMKWQGMLELAKGNRSQAIPKLYAVYQRLKASDRMDTQLAYILAKTFEGTGELGAVNEFLTSALRLRAEDRQRRADSIARRKPSALLDLARVFIRLRAPIAAQNTVNYFENIYGKNEQSQLLKIRALVDSANYEDAEALLTEAEIKQVDRIKLESRLLQEKLRNSQIRLQRRLFAEDANIVGENDVQQDEIVDEQQLNREIADYRRLLTEKVKELLSLEPNAVSSSLITNLCNGFEEQGQTDKARQLAELFLQEFPKDVAVNTYLKLMEAGDNISDQKQAQIREQVIKELQTGPRKHLSLGQLCLSSGEPNEAIKHFMQVVKTFEEEAENLSEEDELRAYAYTALSYALETSIRVKDWQTAEEATTLAQRYNVDRCGGDFFTARLSAAREDYDTALEQIERCLEQRPIFSSALVLRAQIKEALGRTDEAVEDYRQAVHFNPMSPDTNKALALALYRRNRKLGDNVNNDQFIEAKETIERAISTNRGDVQLLSFYAEYISDTEPERALAIRQRLLERIPTVQNALLLANMAFDHAQNTYEKDEKQALIDIASDAYARALQLEPANQAAIAAYAEFCRSTGREQEAEQMISETEDPELKWRYYFKTGQFRKAKEIMEQLYPQQPDNEQLIQGLLSIATRELNQEEVKKYSAALLEADDSVTNNLIQIQAYLSSGLVSEAETKLESFSEKYPDEPLGQLLKASLYKQQGKFEEALDLVNRSLQTDETNPKAWLLRGQIHRLLADETRAINDLRRSKSLDDNEDVRIALAKAYMANDRPSDAVAELLPIVDEPTTPDNARLLLEFVYSRSGDYQGLVDFYSRMMEQFPDVIMWRTKAADFAFRRGNYETAQRLYGSAWQMSLDSGNANVDILDRYLSSLVSGDKVQQAIDLAGKYVDGEPEFAAVALVGIARAKTAMDDRDAAIEHFKMAAEKVKDSPVIVSNILHIMYNLIGPEEVEKYCQQKLQENSDSLLANYVLYQLARSEGNLNKAVDFLDECIRIEGADSQQGLNFLSDKGTLLTLAFQRYSDNTYLRRAIETWQRILEKMPNNSGVLNNVAYLMAQDDQKLELALDYAKKALDQSPNNSAVMDTYAYVLYKNGRFEEAVEYAQAALQQYEMQQTYAPAEMYYHLGMFKEKLGQKEGALDAYKKALELGKDSLSAENTGEIESAIERLSI